MSEKWKYILKIALFWSIFMTAFIMLFEYFDKESETPLISWKIGVRFIVYFMFGIGLGFFNWRTKEKRKANP